MFDLGNVDLENLKMGQVDAMAGKASVEYVIKAVQLVSDGEIDAIATAPINKESINKAGYNFAGTMNC